MLQSGHCYNEWSIQKKPRENAARLAKQLGYQDDDDDVNKIATFLKAQPVENIVKAVRDFQNEWISVNDELLRWPIRTNAIELYLFPSPAGQARPDR